MISSVDGWIVSPRKSRRKSACFSRTRTAIPARASNNASIIPAGPPPAMQQRTEISRVSTGSPFHASGSSPSWRFTPYRRSAGESLSLDRRRWREMQHLLERFHLFGPRGLFGCDIVAIGRTIRLGDGRLGRNNAHGRAPCHPLGAEVSGHRSFVIGLGHRGTFCLSER